MKILFTGGSSFTGCWFIRELARAGHEVTATFRQTPDAYPEDLRKERATLALEHSTGEFGCSFGDDRFMQLLESESWDALCHHAADVTNYKSDDFDVDAAVANNTRNAPAIVNTLARQNAVIVVTGSVFENDEGAGEDERPAFSPYGRSKALTWQVFEEQAKRAGIGSGKFVIPNPFGPLEEPRFTAYLMKNWFAGNTPGVNTPAYVRDNIHVSLLALAYRDFVTSVSGQKGNLRLNPSGYVETQGEFAQRFATAMQARLNIDCALELADQTEFAEPRVRYNTDPVDSESLNWDESAAWDDIANYYHDRLGVKA